MAMCSMPTCCLWFWSAMMVVLHTMQVELAAAAGNFPLHSRAEIVDVELRDLLRILSGLDVDVSELHGHARLLLLGCTKGRRGGARRSQLGRASIGTQPVFARFPAFSRAGFRPHRCRVTASTNADLWVVGSVQERGSLDSPGEESGFELFVPLKISAFPSWWSRAREGARQVEPWPRPRPNGRIC